jgi:hypothetical protein
MKALAIKKIPSKLINYYFSIASKLNKAGHFIIGLTLNKSDF